MDSYFQAEAMSMEDILKAFIRKDFASALIRLRGMNP